ncbi:MAG: hypothetical protein ABIT01_12140 [Thermoanaerobaculia bacterium]
MRAAADLASCSVLPGFNQAEFKTLPLKRIERWDLGRDVAEPLNQTGGGVFFQFDLMLLRLLTGQIDGLQRAWATEASRYVLETDRRPEWRQRAWKERVWKLTADLLAACYWLDAPELARNTLKKTWMAGGKNALEWGDVPDVWTRKRMDWLDFAFWRSWWVEELNLRPQEHLDRGRVLSHAVSLFGEARQINATLGDYVAMAHANFYARQWPMEICVTVNRLLEVEPRAWK